MIENLGQQVEKCCDSGPISAPATIRQQLERQANDIQIRLDRVKAAIKALDENPNVAEVFETVTKALRY